MIRVVPIAEIAKNPMKSMIFVQWIAVAAKRVVEIDSIVHIDDILHVCGDGIRDRVKCEESSSCHDAD